MRAGRSAFPAVAVLLALALVGCDAMEEMHRRLQTEATAAPPPPRVKPERVTPPPPRPKPNIARTVVPERNSEAALSPDPALPSDPAPLADPTPALDPESLIGLKPAQAIAVLGDPTSVRERSPSMVWRYNQGDCALDLFFYLDLGANAFRVLAYEIRRAASIDGTASACPARLLTRANAR